MPRLGPNLWDDPNFVLGTILPKSPSFDLGSPTLPFRNLYLSGSVVGSGDETLSGNLTFSAASAKIIPGATSLLFRNHADTFTNLTILDNGNVTARGILAGQAGGTISGGNFAVTGGSILIQSTGEGFYQKVGGANARGGTVVVNGTTPVVVASTAMNADAVIVFSLKTVGGTVGAIPHVSTYTIGTSFTIVGTASDTSTYNWMMMNLQ